MQKGTKPGALDAALNLLTYKDRTKAELVKRLQEKDYDTSEILAAIDKLSQYGYINDTRYATTYVRTRVTKGPLLIKRELTQKGLDRDTINEAIEQTDRDETSDILEILRRHYATADLTDTKTRHRIYSYLTRRGFTSPHIHKALALHAESNI